jgi:hypothetical protein
METINLLIVASSDMDGTDDNFNLPNDVLNITFPCDKYKGKTLNLCEKYQEQTNKSPRCSKCHYTKVEHNYGYPLYPLHPIKTQIGVYDKSMGKLAGKPIYGKVEYSDLWMNKTLIFERIKFIYGDNININYHTITPTYKNDLTYLPTINKINTIIENNLKLKGKITYQEPYHFSCMLDKLYNQEGYKNTLYDCIFVVSGNLGWLYTPENFKIMTKLLQKDITKPAVIGNLMNKPKIEKPEYFGQFKFMNPINSMLKNRDVLLYSKQDINKCIRNYTKILLGNKFVEAYEMLIRTNIKQSKKTIKNTTKKSIKHKKTKTNKPKTKKL